MTEIRVLPNGLISREDAAKCVGVKPGTLAKWNSTRRHEEFFKKYMVGGRVYYDYRAVKAFAGGPSDQQNLP